MNTSERAIADIDQEIDSVKDSIHHATRDMDWKRRDRLKGRLAWLGRRRAELQTMQLPLTTLFHNEPVSRSLTK
jgi:hypothetical protein